MYKNSWAAIMKSARSGSSWSGSETNRTFLNTGGGQFSDASYISGFGFDDDGRALAITDWDGDGDLDLWAHNRTAPRLRLLRNSSPKANRSVAFRLKGGEKSNPIDHFASRRSFCADKPCRFLSGDLADQFGTYAVEHGFSGLITCALGAY